VFYGSVCISLGSFRRLNSEVVGHFIEKMPFGKKRPLAGRLSKFRSENIHRNTDPRIVCKFPIRRQVVDERNDVWVRRTIKSDIEVANNENWIDKRR